MIIREMVCSEGVNGAGEYSYCIVVNATCCAAHLPTSKNLPHVIDLLAQHIYFLLRTDKLLCLDIALG